MNTGFKSYGLSEELLKALNLLKFQEPTPVQQAVIPAVLSKQDVVVQSKTGSGKTGAFAIPICEAVCWEENKPQALVLTPTRELAVQVTEDFFNIGRFKRIKVVALYGKAPFEAQRKAIKQKTHVVVGTPGRTLDHLERGTWETDQIKYLVIDEADEMLKMGFIEAVRQIIAYLPIKRLTMLFSATMPKDIVTLCEELLDAPQEVIIESKVRTTETIEQTYYAVKETEKLACFDTLITLENPDSCMVFANTKIQVDTIYDELLALGYTCAKIHGGMEQRERLQVMEDFRKGKFRYLVATDVAARGIDIDHVTLVINYDTPEDKENYVHRIGRTGRAGRSGKAFTFVTPRDQFYLKQIEDYIGHTLTEAMVPDEGIKPALKEAFQEKMKSRLQVEERVIGTDIMKLHINAGKKTKMRPVDIVGTLCNIEGMCADDIGIINVLDVSTFVEILNNKGELVLKALQTRPIKGRIRRVSRCEPI